MVTKTKKRSRNSNRKTITETKRSAPSPGPSANGNGSAPSNFDVLRKMYSEMLKCRMMEDRAHADAAGSYDVTTGHEAVVIGATIDLKPEDSVAASSRNLAARIAMGTSLKYLLKETPRDHSDEAMVSSIFCRCASPGSSPSAAFLIDPFNLGTGIALSHKLETKTNVVVAFWHQDAGSLDASHEALKFAGIHKLPIIYVTRSAHLPDLNGRKHSALDEFSFVAKDYGFPSILVDGNDVVAVWRATQESIHRARNGAGATLIECQSEPARFNDPLGHMQHYMTKRGAWAEDWKQQLVGQIEKEMEEAISPA